MRGTLVAPVANLPHIRFANEINTPLRSAASHRDQAQRDNDWARRGSPDPAVCPTVGLRYPDTTSTQGIVRPAVNLAAGSGDPRRAERGFHPLTAVPCQRDQADIHVPSSGLEGKLLNL